MNLPFGLGTTGNTPSPTAASISAVPSTNSAVKSVPLPFGIVSSPTISSDAPLPFGIKNPAPVAPTTPPAVPDALKPTVEILRSAVGGIKQATDNATKPSWNPLDWSKAAEDAYSSAITEAGNRVNSAFQNWQTDTTSKKIADVGLAASGVVGAILSPIGALFKATEAIPVIGRAAVGINALFGAIGNGSGEAANQILQALPIDQDTKDNLSQVVKEAGSLAGQILAGKAGIDDVGALTDKTKQILNGIKKKIIVETPTSLPVTSETPTALKVDIQKPPVTKVPVQAGSPAQTPVDVRTSEYKNPSELPVINMGEKPKEALPTIQTEVNTGQIRTTDINGNVVETKLPSGLRYDPLPNEQTPIYYHATTPEAAADIAKSGFKSNEVQLTTDKAQALEQAKGNPAAIVEVRVKDGAQEIPRSTGAPLYIATDIRPVNVGIDGIQAKPIEGRAIAKSASDINKTYVEKGFGTIPPEEQARFNSTTRETQIKKVSDLMTNDLATARHMIRGEVPVPHDMQAQVLFNAMEAKATREGDASMLRDLARSPIATKLSEAAQALGAHGYSDNPNSPVKAIQDIAKAREAAVAKRVKDISRTKKDIVKEIDGSIKSVKPKKQSWVEFVRTIQC